MDRLWAVVDRWVNSPYLNLIVGLLLVLTALFELTDTLVEEVLGVEVQAAHAIILLGILTLARALEEIPLGLERVRRVRGDSAATSDSRPDRDRTSNG